MSYRILVVDDSAVIRAMVKKTIKMSGLDVSDVFEAGNGKQALDVLDAEWVDVVFADLNMPEMGGEEMIARMEKDDVLVSTPVIIISSERNPEKIAALKERGVRAYMTKPFKPEAFRDVVFDVLGATGGS